MSSPIRTMHRYLFGRHVLVTFKATVASGTIALLCALKVKDPGLTLDLLSGVEGVESAEPARIMWSLGRMIVASPKLTELFDQGVDATTWPALQAMPEAKEFVARLRRFPGQIRLSRAERMGAGVAALAHATRGPAARDRPIAPVGRRRRAGRRLRGAAFNNRQAARYARRKLGLLDRLKFNKALPAARAWQASREGSKSAVIRALDSTRRAVNELARRVAERHRLTDPAGSTCSTTRSWRPISPIPSRSSRVIDERKRAYEALAERIPPFLFEGEMPALDTWTKRTLDDEASGQKGDILEGIGGSPGRVTGVARIVMDASRPRRAQARRHPGRADHRPLLDAAIPRRGWRDRRCRRGDEPFGHRLARSRYSVRGFGDRRDEDHPRRRADRTRWRHRDGDDPLAGATNHGAGGMRTSNARRGRSRAAHCGRDTRRTCDGNKGNSSDRDRRRLRPWRRDRPAARRRRREGDDLRPRTSSSAQRTPSALGGHFAKVDVIDEAAVAQGARGGRRPPRQGSHPRQLRRHRAARKGDRP